MPIRLDWVFRTRPNVSVRFRPGGPRQPRSLLGLSEGWVNTASSLQSNCIFRKLRSVSIYDIKVTMTVSTGVFSRRKFVFAEARSHGT